MASILPENKLHPHPQAKASTSAVQPRAAAATWIALTVVVIGLGLPVGCTGADTKDESLPPTPDKRSVTEIFKDSCPTDRPWQPVTEKEGKILKLNNGICGLFVDHGLNYDILNLINPFMQRIRYGLNQNAEFIYADVLNQPCVEIHLFFVSKRVSMAYYWKEDEFADIDCRSREYQVSKYNKRRGIVKAFRAMLSKYPLQIEAKPPNS